MVSFNDPPGGVNTVLDVVGVDAVTAARPFPNRVAMGTDVALDEGNADGVDDNGVTVVMDVDGARCRE